MVLLSSVVKTSKTDTPSIPASEPPGVSGVSSAADATVLDQSQVVLHRDQRQVAR